jgi:putrescine aminotransferase
MPSVGLPDSKQVKQWYQQHVNPGFYSLLSFMGLDSAEVEAEGWTVRAADGREYIDCVGGYGSYNFGHRHPQIVAAVQEQLNRMPMSSKLLLNPVLAGLCADLAAIAPGELQYSFISNSGTEAVEAALKIARLRSGKHGFISAHNAYHGKTLGSLSSTHRDSFQQPFRPLLAGFAEVPFGDLAAVEAAIDDDTAGLLVEPVQGEGGINVAPPGYLTGLREITRRRGVLLIVDEVQTGLGRTGRNFACERERIEPDILVLAKSLGGGVMPIGATMGTPWVWEPLIQSPLIHTSTFGGNELACAAGRAALALLQQERLAEKAEADGAYFLEGLRTLAGQYPEVIREVRGQGLMIGISTQSQDISQLLIASIIQQQVLFAFALNKPDVLRVEPPLVIPRDVIDEVLCRLGQALADTRGIVREYGLTPSEEAA